MPDVDLLFDEFAASYVRGDRPDVRAFLARAGGGADELARLIDRFVRAVPAPEPSEDDVAVMRARLEGEPGLLALRIRRRQRVDDVVADLAERLSVDDLPRLKRYYQRLEGATLDPRRIDQRVWDALRGLFATNVRAIVRPVTTTGGASAMAYYRRAGTPPDAGLLASLSAPDGDVRSAAVPPDPDPADRDELDRLFLGEA